MPRGAPFFQPMPFQDVVLGAVERPAGEAVVKRVVIVESPYGSRWFWVRWRNRRYARACLQDCLKRGEAPFASHLLYTQRGVLRDHDPVERERGISAGLAWGKKADATVVYTDRGISSGMVRGIDTAVAASRPVEYRSIRGAR